MANIGKIKTPDGTSYDINAKTINGHTVEKDVPSNAVFTDNDTKNTAGSTNTSSKIYLIGATSQAANPQTYSHDTAYVGTDGCLYSDSKKVLTSHQDISGKQDTITGGATTITSSNLTASRALVSNSNGKVAVSAVTSTELGYLDGVTSNVQTQLGDKLSTSGGTISGNINRKTTSIGVDTSSNNGVSNNFNVGYNIYDKNDYWFAQFHGYASTSGLVTARMGARNKQTDGTEVTNYFYVGVKKDGAPYYYLGDSTHTSAFRTAIGLGSMATEATSDWQPKLTEQWLDLKSDASISSGTSAKNCGQFTIEKGTWLIMITVRFSPNEKGFRGFSVNTGSATGSNIGMMFTDIKDAANGQYTYCRSFGLHAVSASTTLYIGGWQNSGSTLTYSTRVHLVKLH